MTLEEAIIKSKMFFQNLLESLHIYKKKTISFPDRATLEEIINKSKIILPEHKREFLAFIEKLPHDIYKKLYGNTIRDIDNLYQGDVVSDVSICFVDDDGEIAGGNDFVALISNSCDMQPNRNDFIIVSPIVVLEEYVEEIRSHSPEKVDNTLKDIRGNAIYNLFYLPQKNGLPECFVDLSRMVSISSIFLNRIKKDIPERCLLSLSQLGWYFFLIKLTYHFARREVAN